MDLSENRSSCHVSGLWLVDFNHFPTFFFPGLSVVAVIMTDGSQKHNIIVIEGLNFRVQVLLKGTVRSL